MGLPDDYAPESYFCEQCKPEDHKELLAAIARGEKPEAIAARNRAAAEEEKAGGKKKGRKGRKGTARPSENRDTPTTETEEPVSNKKRKLEETPVPDSKVGQKSRTMFNFANVYRLRRLRALRTIRNTRAAHRPSGTPLTLVMPREGSRLRA